MDKSIYADFYLNIVSLQIHEKSGYRDNNIKYNSSDSGEDQCIPHLVV